MKATRTAMILLCITIAFEIITFILLIAFNASKGLIVIMGVVIVAYILAAKALSVISNNEYRKSAKSPLQINMWAFEPITPEDDIDGFREELLSFITSKNQKNFVPRKDQKFRIWWEGECLGDDHVTGIVKKMTHGEGDEIIIETDADNYVGHVKDNFDLIMVDEPEHEEDEQHQ